MPTLSPSVTTARQELTRFLIRAQSRGILSPATFADLQRQWSGTSNSLPASPEDMPATIDDKTIAIALLALITLSRKGRKKAHQDTSDEMRDIVAAWTLRQFLDVHEKVQDEYERRSRGFAIALVAGLLSFRAWHLAQRYHVVQHLVQQAVLGYRGSIPGFDIDRLQALLQRELGYLDRFADQITARQLSGKPFSAEYIANRAEAYAGTGRGEFYRALERQRDLLSRFQPADVADDFGLVAEYIALDDNSTCNPCHQAQGIYPLGVGPFPGAVCLGRSHCRCRRVIRYDPVAYRALV